MFLLPSTSYHGFEAPWWPAQGRAPQWLPSSYQLFLLAATVLHHSSPSLFSIKKLAYIHGFLPGYERRQSFEINQPPRIPHHHNVTWWYYLSFNLHPHIELSLVPIYSIKCPPMKVATNAQPVVINNIFLCFHFIMFKLLSFCNR